MEPFLKHTAKDLYNRYQDKVSELCVVFPNRRASLYFKKYLSELTDKPIWSPSTTTINELMQDISELTLADNIKLLFELYTIYKQVKKTDESFDDFYFWGEMMLNDFDDIDKYLINPEDLFKNLKSLKSIQDQFTYLSDEQIDSIKQFWQSFDPEKHSVHQDQFISIWNVLLDIYKTFNEQLKKLGVAYEGMIYRLVVDKIEGSKKLDLPNSRYVFTGFNALNQCEKKLFSYLQNNKLADFYWDYDESYINNRHHEAGYFLRDNIREYNAPPSFLNQNIFSALSSEKEIEIISAPTDIGQAKIITQVLQESEGSFSDSPNKTALVLADEEMLIPVLQSVPDTIEQVNITMGYPVNNTPVYSLLEHIIDLQKNAKKSKRGTTFYHENVLAILHHQYIHNLFEKESKELNQIINEKNRIVILDQELGICDFFESIFVRVESYQDLSEYLLNILHHIYNSLKKSGKEDTIHTSALEKEYIYHIYLSINRLKDVLQEQQINIKLETYIRLIRKIIRNLRIPFTGEPLSGLQIMGILETRLLDFENLFITSLNEGVLPKTDAALSFVPYSLRRGFGLPTIEHQDAIYAYYFYRLIQRAKKVHFIYNSSSDGMQTGEMSRFLYQLKYESNFKIKEKSLRYDINITQAKEIRIEKTPEILKKLDKYIPAREGSKYLSPSALNTYIKCSLQFYFRYVAELREQDEITEEIDAPLFGNILHDAMDHLYAGFKNHELTSDELKNISKEQINKSIDEAFKQNYFKSDTIDYTGKNIIIREVIEKYVHQIIKIDAQVAPFKILSLEDQYEIELPLENNGSDAKVKLGGKIDRVDQLGKHIRIIDYKTGKDKLDFKDVESLFTDVSGNRRSAVFQTFLYSKFYKDIHKPILPIIPGVYSVRELFKEPYEYRITQSENRKKSFINDYGLVESEYLEHLNQLIEQIFDPKQAFTQTEETRTCDYCPYRKICHR